MAARSNASISSRKQPKQARSNGLVTAVLDAAAQVLAAEGAHRFTTARVARRAGVSVGSLYQYFPNKAAILFRLQSEEWRRTNELLGSILRNRHRLPHARLRATVHAFICSECEEASVRVALGDAAPLYRDAPEARETKASGAAVFQAFMQEMLPKADEDTRAKASDLIVTTMTLAGKRFSGEPRTRAEMEGYASAMADMFCAYLDRLSQAVGRNERSEGKEAAADEVPIRRERPVRDCQAAARAYRLGGQPMTRLKAVLNEFSDS